MEQQQVKRVPYGVSDFVKVIEQNQYYVDKTMYLPMLEDEPSYLFFIRPRRFGKSIFLSMLHAYYDCRTKDKFEQWFGGLWIGCHPTPLQGQFQILHLDFSQVGGTIEKLEENFNFYLGVALNGFVRDYAEYYSDSMQKQLYGTDNAGGKLALIQSEAKSRGYSLYLIIDEYDNFTNTVLNEQGEDVYWAITHAEGFYRDIFKKCGFRTKSSKGRAVIHLHAPCLIFIEVLVPFSLPVCGSGLHLLLYITVAAFKTLLYLSPMQNSFILNIKE